MRGESPRMKKCPLGLSALHSTMQTQGAPSNQRATTACCVLPSKQSRLCKQDKSRTRGKSVKVSPLLETQELCCREPSGQDQRPHWLKVASALCWHASAGAKAEMNVLEGSTESSC